jgi:hypothetical protein
MAYMTGVLDYLGDSLSLGSASSIFTTGTTYDEADRYRKAVEMQALKRAKFSAGYSPDIDRCLQSELQRDVDNWLKDVKI